VNDLLDVMKNYGIDDEDRLKCNSCCVEKIELDESLSLFNLSQLNSDGEKPQLACLYRENLNKIVKEIEQFDPFGKKPCQKIVKKTKNKGQDSASFSINNNNNNTQIDLNESSFFTLFK
jgi:hypothetical protein